MTHPRDSLPVPDRIGVALEAACDALMTLQSIDVPHGTTESDRAEEHVGQAISDLLHAINELRETQVQDHNGLALGFVLARDERNSGGERELGQSRPRRTA